MNRSRTGRSRGQTSLDLLVGVGVFMLTIAFVLGVIPGVIEPFSEAQENTLVADRSASQISEWLLAESGSPSVLNETCTYAFFETGHGSDSGCPFDASDSLSTVLGFDDDYRASVSIKRNVSGDATPEVLCTDGSTVGECAGGVDDPLEIGPTPPEENSVITARRTVYIDGKDATLVVNIW